MLFCWIPERTEQSNHGKYRDADGLPERLKQGVKHYWSSLFSSCICFSFWVDYLRLASSTWQETLLSTLPELYILTS